MENANMTQNPLSSDQVPAATFIKTNLTLKCVGGTLNGRSYPIFDGLCIGRNTAFCNVLYPEGEPGISGTHCKIILTNGQAQLIDMGSSVGTFINGVQILPNVPYSMPVGSSFYLGSPNNVFLIAEEAPPPFANAGNPSPAGTPAPFANTGNPPPAGTSAPFANAGNPSPVGTPVSFANAGNLPPVGTPAPFANAGNPPPAGTPVPFANAGNPTPAKKPVPWIAIVSVAALIAAAVILFLLFGKNQGSVPSDDAPAETGVVTQNKPGNSAPAETGAVTQKAQGNSAPAETYTGVTGKAFVIPDAGFVNLVFDGKEQKNTANYRSVNQRSWIEDKHLSVSLGEDRFIAWDIATSSLPLKTGASYSLADLSENNGSWISAICDETDYYNWAYDWAGENRTYFDEANLTVLELNGNKITFYFYLKLRNNAGKSHTAEGVACAALDRAGASDTYTGISGKTFAMPAADVANIVFDGKEQTVQAIYGIPYESDGPHMNTRVLDLTLEDGIFTQWGYVQWDFDISAVSWKTGMSFNLDDLSGYGNRNSLSLYCNGTSYEGYSRDREFDEATLTVLELDGDEVIFYFCLKPSKDGESHTLEGVARAVLMPVN